MQSDADARARSEAGALARARAWVDSKAGGLLGLAAAGAAALLGAELLKRGACGTLGALGDPRRFLQVWKLHGLGRSPRESPQKACSPIKVCAGRPGCPHARTGKG